MISNFPKLLRNRRNYPVLQNLRKLNLINGGSLFKRHRLETERCRSFVPMLINVREIRRTKPKNALNPFTVMLQITLFEILPLTSGMILRKWWQKLGPDDKKIVFEKLLKKRRQIATVGTFVTVVLISYYGNHIDETPVTKRKRFIMIDEKLREKIGKAFEEKQLMAYKNDVVPVTDGHYKRTKKIIEKIISANKDLPQIQSKDWELIVIDKPNLINAISMPNGKIVVFSGMFALCSNDDQLAAVISHEISHTMLNHYPEEWSRMIIVQFSFCLSTFIAWTIFRNLLAFAIDLLFKFLALVLVNLRYSRMSETEADMVGLLIAARACFDVTQVPVLLKKMQSLKQTQFPFEWLSSHPSDEKRKENLARMMPFALQLRTESNCPTLTDFQYFYLGAIKNFFNR